MYLMSIKIYLFFGMYLSKNITFFFTQDDTLRDLFFDFSFTFKFQSLKMPFITLLIIDDYNLHHFYYMSSTTYFCFPAS